MRLNPYCMCCQINKQEENIRQFDDEKKKMQYMKEILLRLTALRDEDCAPSISVEFKKFFKEFWDVEDTTDFDAIKKDFNSLMMNLEDKLTRNIRAAKDPLESALIHARIGNYIDFGAIPDANKEQLLTLIEEGSREPLDVTEYTNFQRNMENAEALVYLTDNCGEIVLDKIAVQLLKERYPNVKITVIVRGMPCINDATMEDAEMCALQRLCL